MTKLTGGVLSPNRPALMGLLFFLLAAGLAIRLYDLSDLPLDFHPTRQLLSHLKARGMYYQPHTELPDWQRKMAIQQWKTKAEVEPEVFERLVATTYELTGVQPAVARVYASIFWVLGAAFLFMFVREWVSADAGLVSAAYFLFFPYAITASRSFQPDVPMVALVLCFWWTFARWIRSGSWTWAVLAGISGGLAIFVKFVAAFFVIGAALGMGVGTLGRRLLKYRQLWIMAAIGALPTLGYLYYGLFEQAFLARQFGGRFIPSLLLSPRNYVQWAALATLAAGALAIAIGLLGLIVIQQKPLRSLLAGLWISYLLYGLFFDYHIATHDYYQLPLIAVVAVSTAPIASLLMRHLEAPAARPWKRLSLIGIFVFCVLAGVWSAREQMSAVDYRPQAEMWSEIGDKLDHGPNVVALTQDYGSRLAYWGWQNSIIWPTSGDMAYTSARGGLIEFDEVFEKLTLGNTYFLVTDFEELERQPALGQALAGYELFAEGDGYVIYDLEQPRGF